MSASEFADLKRQVEALAASIGDVGSLEATVNDVISVQTEMASCMSDAVGIWGDDSPTGPVDPVDPTSAPEEEGTTEPEEEVDYSEYGTVVTLGYDGVNNRCGLGPDARAFKLDFTTLENCMVRCTGDPRCVYATSNYAADDNIAKYCIGCITLTSHTEGWVAYETVVDETATAAPAGEFGGPSGPPGRRSLTQLELLEQENAALKEMIEELRDELRRR